MKTLWKIICLIARLAAVFAVLSLLAQWLSRGHEGRRYLYSRELTDDEKPQISHITAGRAPCRFCVPRHFAALPPHTHSKDAKIRGSDP